MKFIRTDIPDVVILESTVFPDSRGWFTESFNERRFQEGLRELGLTPPRAFVQDNHSSSSKGVLRGLHYQMPPYPQGKLVRVVNGAAFDVAVDIRRGSPSFGKWVGVELTAQNHRSLWIPEGFAHGFIALEDETHFLYKTTDYYARDCERTLCWDDPDIGIAWPALSAGVKPTLAEKDASARTLAQATDTADIFG